MKQSTFSGQKSSGGISISDLKVNIVNYVDQHGT